MPLSDEEAQMLLIASIDRAGSRWALHIVSGCYYRFFEHGDNVFHGYKVEPQDVPAPIINELKEERGYVSYCPYSHRSFLYNSTISSASLCCPQYNIP